MYFRLRISTGIDCERPSDYFNPGKGLDFINAVREDLRNPNIPIDVIQHDTNSCRWSNEDSCHIDEYERFCTEIKEASSVFPNEPIVTLIPQFAAQSSTIVYVPPGFLSRYQIMQYAVLYRTVHDYATNPYSAILYGICYPFYHRYHKVIKSVDVSYTFDKLAFLKDWISAGCPEYFNCDKQNIIEKQAAYKVQLEEKKEKEKKAKEAETIRQNKIARDRNKIRLIEYAQDLLVMQKRLELIAKDYRE